LTQNGTVRSQVEFSDQAGEWIALAGLV
jgi:hypothetical protein